MILKCPCCSEKSYEECCKPVLEGKRTAETAEELMRSRYSAYATGSVDYLKKTTHKSTRKFFDFQAIERWAKSSKWLKLEILEVKKGTSDDFEGFVKFKATYENMESKLLVHEEDSHFLKEKGEWYFLEGKVKKY